MQYYVVEDVCIGVVSHTYKHSHYARLVAALVHAVVIGAVLIVSAVGL